MKKFVIGLVVLVLLIAGGVYLVLSNLDAIVKAAIEHYGSEVTQTKVRVDKVKLDLQKGSAGVYGLTIANPKGFETKQAFSLGQTSVQINLDSLRKPVLVLDDVTVRAPKISYEMNAEKQGSLNALYDNISKSLPADGGKGTGAGKGASDSAPKLIIRSLVFEGAAVEALVVPLESKRYNVKLPPIRMRNLGAPNGATPEALAKEILARITRDARDEVKRQVIDKQLGAAVEAERKKLESAAQQRLEEEKKKAEQGLKDLFKR